MPNNYTVSTSALTADVGDQVNLTTPLVYLTITADPGYTVTAGDFSVGDALPSEITSVVFVQDGETVIASVTLDDSFIMPAAVVNLGIDIDGTAELIEYTIAGTYAIVTDNTNLTTAPSTAYSASGTYGEVVALFTLTFTADADHAFEVDPTYINYLTNQFPAKYTITRDDTYTGSDLTEVEYTVTYTITENNVAGDTLKFTANAAELLVIGEGGSEKYYSYVFEGFEVQDISGDYYTDRAAQTHMLTVFGDVGALITVDIDDGGGPVNLYTNAEITYGGGYAKLPISFDAVGSDTDYTITLSGDISASFIQPNPIEVHAAAGINVIVSHTPIAGYTITRTGNYSFSRIEGVVPGAEQVNYKINANFKVTADDGSTLKMLRTPSWINDISNINPLTNDGTFILYPPNMTYSGDGTTEITINASATITKFGGTNVTAYLSFVGMFNLNPVAVDDSAAVTKGGTVLIDVLANDTDGDTDPLTPVIITQPTYGTAVIEGTSIRYTHNNSNNYEDSFTYAANDGYINSNTATVSIGVGLAAGDSLTLSATDGIFYIPVVVGDAGGEFTIHFDSGSVPDRVEMIYEGDIVADTLFIGDDLTGGGRAAAITAITDTVSLNSFDYVGTGGNGTTYGKTAAWNLNTLANVVAYADPADIAPTPNVRGVTSNYGNQVGVGDLVYTSAIDAIGTTGLDSADGNASLSYVKASGGESVVTLKITGISGTGWSIYQTSMV